VLLLLVLPMVLVEAGVRALIATHRIPVGPAHLRDFEISWTNLERLGSVDVLILGDSVSQQGLYPATVRDQLTRELGRPVTTFNMASAAGTLGINVAISHQLAAEGRLPKVVLIGVQPGLLRGDATFGRFAATPVGQMFTACEGFDTLESQLSCRLSQASAAWRWRGHALALARSLTGEVRRTSRHEGLTLREDGFRAGDGLPDDVLLEQLAQHLEVRPEAFEMGADARARYLELADFLTSHGVRLVPVAVPEAPPLEKALEARHPGWTAEWRAALEDLSSATGIRITDPMAFGSWYHEGSMRNIKHLSEEGARRFTEQVLAMPAVHDALVQALGAS
jgi:hypothetical protein